MKINPDKCVACGNCTYVCPMGAIYIDPVDQARDREPDRMRRVLRLLQRPEPGASESDDGADDAQGLPVDAPALRSGAGRLPDGRIRAGELTWPRVVRRAFSDPRVPHESTGVEGRGTEEVKTNDISGRVKVGEVGFTIEFGRPGVGVWFRDIQKMCWALAEAGVSFEKKNPITSLMSDVATGTIARGHSQREGALGDRRDQGSGGAHRGDHPAGVGGGEGDRHGGRDRRGHALRRERRGSRRGADSGAARLQAGARQDEYRAGPDHESATWSSAYAEVVRK